MAAGIEAAAQNIMCMNILRFKYVIIISLLIGFAVPGYFMINEYFTGERVMEHGMRIIGFLYSILVSISIFSVNMPVVRLLHRKFPMQKNNVKRIAIEMLVTNILAGLTITCVFYVFHYLVPFQLHYNLGLVLYQNIIIAIILNTIVMLGLEGAHWFRQWKMMLVETEKLKRESVESKYNVLVSQVNPHFLFNNLNALSSLIKQSPEKALDFVNRFSKVYRYVLDVKDKYVVELKDELEFLQSYFFLHKIRHGNNLNIQKKVDAMKLNHFVPSLSLQVLVENAIKHNEISSIRPLHISIETEGDYLTIRNNLQKRQTDVGSTGLGITNLKNRYSHFTDAKPVFFVKNNNYVAKIPLLKEEF